MVQAAVPAETAHTASPAGGAQGAPQAWISRFDAPLVLASAGPLAGLRFAAKDNIDTAGLPTTAACPAFAYPPAEHATVVRKLLDSGAQLVGKTNLDQFATGLVGTRSPYGVPSSVFDASRVSGGSSSGSAVAVALGQVAFALGTDTAGSGRVPAAFNGIVGLKPTPGRVSTAGVVPACRSLDCVSIFAASAEDAAAVLAVIEGDDVDDPYSRFQPGAAAFPQRPRIGVPMAPTLDEALDYPAAWRLALAGLEQQATLVPLDMAPLHQVASLLYEGPWVAERLLAVQPLIDQRPEALDATVRRVIERAHALSAADAFRGQYRLTALRRQADALMAQVDFIVVPSVPTHPTHAQVQADPVGANAQLGLYTNFVNLLGWSALALPATRTPGGLPFGVTAIGPANADAALAPWGQAWLASHGAQASAATGPDSVPLPTPAVAPGQRIAVVGAHLSGLPLNAQLTERGAVLERATTTSAAYRLHALPGGPPRRPGLQRVPSGGTAIALEVWWLPRAHWGSFMAGIPAPLAIGRVELADGSWVCGFVCEGHALADAPDISHHGGWRAYLASI
jgi:allophanate hydrolase